MKKHLARHLVRVHGRRPARRGPSRPSPHPNDVTRPLDTWSPAAIEALRKEPEPEPTRPWGRAAEVPEIPSKAKSAPTPEKPKLSKRRDRKITVAMSEEEEHIIRAYLNANDLSLSSWARELIFNAMNKKIPKRR